MNELIKKMLIAIIITCNSSTLPSSIILQNYHKENNDSITNNIKPIKSNNISDNLLQNINTENFTIDTTNKNFYKMKFNLKNTKIKINQKEGFINIIITENDKNCSKYASLIYISNNIFKNINFKRDNNKNIICLKYNKEHPIMTFLDSLNKNIMHLDIAKTKNPFKYNIVLDPGHGGKDFGATVAGVNEKDIVLDITKRMEFKLKEEGINVFYTRKDDTFIKLGERPNLANNLNSDLFVSVHINSNEKEYPEGIATYYFAPFDYQIKERKLLAKTVQAELIKNFPKWKDNGIIIDRLKVLRCSKMPSILVEFGFISNNYDRREMSKPIIREKAATSITNGIVKYLNK